MGSERGFVPMCMAPRGSGGRRHPLRLPTGPPAVAWMPLPQVSQLRCIGRCSPGRPPRKLPRRRPRPAPPPKRPPRLKSDPPPRAVRGASMPEKYTMAPTATGMSICTNQRPFERPTRRVCAHPGPTDHCTADSRQQTAHDTHQWLHRAHLSFTIPRQRTTAQAHGRSCALP